MEIVEDLQKLGFTEYEGRVYLALLQNPDITGYEASRTSGVPRAKVYEVLASMDKKGLVFSSRQEGKNYYRPIPPEMLLERHKERTENVIFRLEQTLFQVFQDYDPRRMVTVNGFVDVMDLIFNMLQKAERRVLITGFPQELLLLEKQLKDCKSWGVKEFVMSYGEVDLDNIDVYQHAVSSMQYLQVLLMGRWLAVVVDNKEVVFAQIMGNDHTTALWTRNPAIVFGVVGFISHDISLYCLEAILSKHKDTLPGNFLTEIQEAIVNLQPMWQYRENEYPQLDFETDITTTELFQGIEKNLEGYRGRSGVIQFDLQGEEGGTWTLKLHERGAVLSEGAAEYADLLMQISDLDFKALILGKLPLEIILTPGRISLKGDIELAGALQVLLKS